MYKNHFHGHFVIDGLERILRRHSKGSHEFIADCLQFLGETTIMNGLLQVCHKIVFFFVWLFFSKCLRCFSFELLGVVKKVFKKEDF